jgi:N-formylglutamate deformylase
MTARASAEAPQLPRIGGVTAERLIRALEPLALVGHHEQLTDPALCGHPIEDERYILITHRKPRQQFVSAGRRNSRMIGRSNDAEREVGARHVTDELIYNAPPGAPTSAVVLHVPHGSRALTAAARQSILLDDDALAAELDHMTDAHTGLIAARAAAAATRTPWLLENRYSRLVVDPERFPDAREEMRAVGMAAVYTRTAHGQRLRHDDDARDEALLAQHYRPYAAAMTDLVDARLAATGHAVIIDVHSYPSRPLPYELHGDGLRPAICLGADSFHTPPELVRAARTVFADFGDIELDTPFAGCYVPLKHYRRQPAVTALMVEIRRDTYMSEPGGPPTENIDRLALALADLVDIVSPAAPPLGG